MHRARSKPLETSLSVKVIRKDGRVEELGTVAYWHRRWYRRRTLMGVGV